MLQLLKLRSIETYVARRQLQWAGHVARMDEHRLPRKFLTSWCSRPRPLRRPEYTYGAGLTADLVHAGMPLIDWMDSAQDRQGWSDMIRTIQEEKKTMRCSSGAQQNS